MTRFAIVAAGVLLAACAAPARGEAHRDNTTAPAPLATAVVDHRSPARAPVDCDIRATRTPQGVRLEATARSGRALRGTYDFTITARGAGGSSDITQGGPFDLAAAERATVGAAEISARRYSAVLTLADADGELCRIEKRS